VDLGVMFIGNLLCVIGSCEPSTAHYTTESLGFITN